MTSHRPQPPQVGPARGSGGASPRKGLLRRRVSPRTVIVLLAALGVLIYAGFAMLTSHLKQSQLQETQRRYQERIQRGYMAPPDG